MAGGGGHVNYDQEAVRPRWIMNFDDLEGGMEELEGECEQVQTEIKGGWKATIPTGII